MSAIAELANWLDDYLVPGVLVFAKRLSANDTLASGSNQAGPYIPKEVMFRVFPSLKKPQEKNPDTWFILAIDSHGTLSEARTVWYNSKVSQNKKKGRNETRVTNLGGAESPLLDPESTASLAVFAFQMESNQNTGECHVWVCDHEIEADHVEDRIGLVEPGVHRVWCFGETTGELENRLEFRSCRLTRSEIPESWLAEFPSGEAIIRKAVELGSGRGLDVDARLMRRRACEYEIFQSIEEEFEKPAIATGFRSIESFINRAQTVLQRRKSRSGRSLELHARTIFVEENLREGTDFQYQPVSEDGRKPDFLFPNEDAYSNPRFPVSRLRMLAAKTSCKERWEQVLGDADRIREKHLLTLQEGMSVKQFTKMWKKGIRLVVPEPLIESYPKTVRPHLQTFESFIGDVRHLGLT